MKEMKLDDNDKKFDMIKSVEKGISIEDFMHSLETK
jgi:hypothetical protein